MSGWWLLKYFHYILLFCPKYTYRLFPMIHQKYKINCNKINCNKNLVPNCEKTHFRFTKIWRNCRIVRTSLVLNWDLPVTTCGPFCHRPTYINRIDFNRFFLGWCRFGQSLTFWPRKHNFVAFLDSEHIWGGGGAAYHRMILILN